MIKYVSLDVQWQQERTDLLDIIEGVLSSGNYVGGEIVEAFEKKVAGVCGVKYAVALNSGTDALVCSMHALGIGRGDEVITPPNSFIASTASIVHLGAVPVFADVLDDQSIDTSQLEKLITSKTKAIMPVHLTGRMADMKAVNEIAERHNLFVIEDAAQSIGSMVDERLSGAWGHVGCFSTHPLKNLNACGDGGFVTTNDENVVKKIKLMRSHGMADRNTVETFGYVSRLDAVQAAILNYRIEHLDGVVRRRRENAEQYRSLLNENHVFSPAKDPRFFDTFHTFVIQVNRRDDLQNFLLKNGVQTAIHYPVPIHLQPAAAGLGHKIGDFPNTESQSKRILTLPINQFITVHDIKFVADLVNDFFEASQ